MAWGFWDGNFSADVSVVGHAAHDGVTHKVIGGIQIQEINIRPRQRQMRRGAQSQSRLAKTTNHAFTPSGFGDGINFQGGVNAAGFTQLNIQVIRRA